MTHAAELGPAGWFAVVRIDGSVVLSEVCSDQCAAEAIAVELATGLVETQLDYGLDL